MKKERNNNDQASTDRFFSGKKKNRGWLKPQKKNTPRACPPWREFIIL